MWIDPFWFGVLVTVSTELGVIILLAAKKTKR